MSRATLLALALLGFTAAVSCQSHADKYTTLSRDANASCLCVEPSCSSYTPTEAQRTQCALAKRKLAQFMNGR